MVMDKNKRPSGNYTYGNLAYDIQPKVKPEVKPVKRTKVKKSKKSQQALKIKLKLVKSIALFGAMTFVILGRAAKINALTENVRFAKANIASMQKENSNIEVQIASACNLKSIEEAALNKFNMVTPKTDDTKYIQVDTLEKTKSDLDENIKAGFDIKRLLGLDD